MHIDCPYCGQDNLLPPDVVQARQRQLSLDQHHYALQLQEQERQRFLHERDKLRQKRQKRLVLWLVAGGFFTLLSFGSCLAIGFHAQQKEEEEKARRMDPKVNGQAAMLARFEEMRQKQGCSRILVQPSTHSNEASRISLDMVKNDACVHVLGMTGTSAKIGMTYQDKIALTRPLPAAATMVDYRLCASESATHSFSLEAAGAEPFTTAAIECPRLPAEGGARSGPEDARKAGKERVQAMLDQLAKASCKHVVSQPKVVRGDTSFTITSPDKSDCYNLLAASSFPDVRLTAVLRDPEGRQMAVPEPSSELRIMYCAPKAGEYKLSITPSTADYYSLAAVDCARFGPEGLKRLNGR
ncbi:MAG: hypothetical protein K0R38_4444 [Polyangiaceae bacterium]|nr:hypothetical protein [Polyangiaceae bacterium]